MRERKQLFAARQGGDESDAVALLEQPEPAVTPMSAVVMAERAVIGAILKDNSLFDVVFDIARAEDFSEPATRAAFEAITSIIEGSSEGITVADPISLACLPSVCQLAPLESLQAWCLIGDGSADAVASHAKVVVNAAAERALGSAVSEAQAIFQKDGASLEEKATSIQQKLAVATDVRSLPVKGLGAAAVEALTELAERASRGDTGIGIPTGFDDLDALTAGLHGGQLIILAARPGIGKTAFALTVGLATAAAGYPTLMASMEMKAKELSKRAMANVSEVDSHALRVGALSASDWEAVVNAAEYLKKLPFDIIDLPSVNLTALTTVARRMHREGKLKVLIIDYLQIMETTSKKNGNREQEVAALSRGLKKLAMELDIPVIALSQLNRAVENRLNRRPQLSDLRESGALEQDADVIMFIHREDEEGEVIVEKQREGPTGVVPIGYAKKNTRFYPKSTPVYGAANESELQAA
jgi:replicative DNA helicase